MNFDEKATDWDKDPKKVERARVFAKEIALLLEESKNLSGLEFGSGTGLVSFELTDRFSSITLADSSVGMLKVLQQKIDREKISTMKSFLVSPSNKLSSLSGFDVIYTLLTLHHIKDVSALFSEFFEILNPGGSLFIGDLITEDGSFHLSDPEFDGHPGFETADLIEMLQSKRFINCRSKVFFEIQRENNSVVSSYPLFFLSARKNK